MNKFFIISLILFIGCTNPFDTREPGKPDIKEPIQPINHLQNNPDSLLKQLQYAFMEPNRNYYESLLADPELTGINFLFVPEPNAALQLTGWTRQDEENYFQKLTQDKNRNDIILHISNVDGPFEIGPSKDTLQTSFSYKIEINLLARKEYYRGQCIMNLFRSSQSLWYIYYWEDLLEGSEGSDSTWSILKATYR
jgi:hypothetical protein